MAVDPDNLQEWHNRGEQDAAEGRSELVGGPWCGVFESFEDYDKRLEAYRSGRENAENQSE